VGKPAYDLALVLGGGGARGLAHIGVIREMIKRDLVPDLIIGTSIGAVVGGMYAQTLDIDYVESRITEIVDRFGAKGKWLGFLEKMEGGNRDDFLHDVSNYIKKYYMQFKALTTLSLEEKEVLYDPLSEFFRNDKIENCRIAFAALSIDLLSGRLVVLRRGSVIDAVYASAAVQGVFPPLEYGNMLLADGGPVALVPVEAAKNMGAGYIVAVDVSAGIKNEAALTTGLQVILRSDLISQERLKGFDLQMADIVISPDVQSVHWVDFGKIKYCIRKGEIAAAKVMEKLSFKKPAGPWWKRLLSFRTGGRKAIKTGKK
jgi:NTE family protein